MGKLTTQVRKYYEHMDNECPHVSRYSRNLTLMHTLDKLDACYHREDLIIQIQKILLRKNKPNVLLTGAAGCGKTAIVEGLAAVIAERKIAYEEACLQAEKDYKAAMRKWEKQAEKGNANTPRPERVQPPKPFLCDCVLYDLSLTAMVGGTKYRGEFEERMQQLLDECKNKPNIILFIDEFHLVCTAGACEGCEGAAQMLKPALARSDIRVIGATTTEEKKMIAEDKALARRFSEIDIQPLAGSAASETAQKILADYCRFHQVSTEISATDLLEQVQYFLPHTVFPDNIINVVDETLAGAVFDEVTVVDMSHFNAVLSRMTGKMILCTDIPGEPQFETTCTVA